MRYSFALFAGAAMAAPALQGYGTETVWATEVETVTSCGPEVTNCPASSTSWSSHPTGYGPPGGYSHGGSWGTTTTSEVVSSATPSSSTSSTPSSSAPTVSPTPYTSSVSSASSTTPISPVTESSSSSTPASPTPYSSSSAPSSSPSSSTTPASPITPTGYTAPPVYPTGSSSTPVAPYPVSSGSPVPSGYASSTGATVKPSATSTPVPYTGGAAGLKVAGSLIGAGAFAALFL